MFSFPRWKCDAVQNSRELMKFISSRFSEQKKRQFYPAVEKPKTTPRYQRSRTFPTVFRRSKKMLERRNFISVFYSIVFAWIIATIFCFKNFQNRKLQVLCAIIFGCVARYLKVFEAFKATKCSFLLHLKTLLLNPSKNMIFRIFKTRVTWDAS